MTSTGRSAFDLSGEVAVVTGAGRGLGAEIARALARAGAAVALTGRSLEALEPRRTEIEGFGGRASTYEWDVTRYEAGDDMLRDIARSLGEPTILVNAAGVATEGAVTETSLADWDLVLDTNLTATFACCRAFFRMGRPGSIINMASVAGGVGVKGIPAYVASKSGVIGLTRALALEGASRGIRVNAIAPGYFSSGMPGRLLEDPSRRDALLRRIPPRRLAQVEEIGPPVVFLASRGASYMTGAVLYFDGGYTTQ